MNANEYRLSRRRGMAWLACALGAILLGGAPAAFGDADDYEWVSLQSLSRTRGFRSYSIAGKKAVLQTKFHSLELERDSRRAVFDGISVWLNGPVDRSWGRLIILQADVDKTVTPLLNPQGALGAAGFGVVVLDAGHGGDDRGASMSGQGVTEKQLTLEMAKSVRDILARYRVTVRLTRADEQQVALEDRSRLAAAWKADLFVSLHFNSAGNSKPSGIETYILAPAGLPSTAEPWANGHDRSFYPGNRYDAANMVLGYTLQKSLLKYTRAEDRGVRHARFVVLRGARCPAALVECGFLSNPGDRKKILAASYRKDLARGIAEGILAYLNAVKRAHNLNT